MLDLCRSKDGDVIESQDGCKSRLTNWFEIGYCPSHSCGNSGCWMGFIFSLSLLKGFDNCALLNCKGLRYRDVVLGTCTCTRVVLEYKSRVLVLVLVLEG